ncbi:MAG: hypothetical protein ACR2QV_12115 [Gammaproteobacteria bacterium]
MIKSNARPLSARLRTGALALLLSLVIVPVSAFIGGSLVVGKYEGPSGLLGYLSAIGRDAMAGHWMAWVLILTPLLLIAIWFVTLKLPAAIEKIRPKPKES